MGKFVILDVLKEELSEHGYRNIGLDPIKDKP